MSLSCGLPVGAELRSGSLLPPDQCTLEKESRASWGKVPFAVQSPHELTGRGPFPTAGTVLLDNGMWKVKADPTGRSSQGPSKEGLSKCRLESYVEEVIRTVGRRIASLSSLHCPQPGVSSRLVRRLWHCPGAGGRGLLSRKPPNPFSGRERRKRESFYSLLFIRVSDSLNRN